MKIAKKPSRRSNSANKISPTYNNFLGLKLPRKSNNLIPNEFSHISYPLRPHPKSRLKSKSGNFKIDTIYTVNETRKMNWKQLKQKFPNMAPNSDADFDGLVNCRDCKPLDPSKDGAFSRFVGIVTGGKKGQSADEYKAEKETARETKRFEKVAQAATFREKSKVIAEKKADKILNEKGFISESKRKKLIEKQRVLEAIRAKVKSAPLEKVEKRVRTFLIGGKKTTVIGKDGKVITITAPDAYRQAIERTGKLVARAVEKSVSVGGSKTTNRKTAKGQSQAGAGRPKQSFKYKDPRTGQPISAVDYHKLRKQLKSQAKAVETKAEVQQRFALAKRGLSPEEVEIKQEEINARMARLRAIKEAKSLEGLEEAQVTTADFTEGQVIQQQVRQIPTQIIQRVSQVEASPIRPVITTQSPRGVPPGYRVSDDIMTGRKTLVAEPKQEAWSR